MKKEQEVEDYAKAQGDSEFKRSGQATPAVSGWKERLATVKCATLVPGIECNRQEIWALSEMKRTLMQCRSPKEFAAALYDTADGEFLCTSS